MFKLYFSTKMYHIIILNILTLTGTCDFESPGTCGWTNNHVGVWKKMAGAQDYYGPGYDHSLGTGDGHYMIAESSWWHYGDDDHSMEEISTPVFGLTGKRCRLRMYYAAELGVNGTMEITVKNDAGSFVSTTFYVVVV